MSVTSEILLRIFQIIVACTFIFLAYLGIVKKMASYGWPNVFTIKRIRGVKAQIIGFFYLIIGILCVYLILKDYI